MSRGLNTAQCTGQRSTSCTCVGHQARELPEADVPSEGCAGLLLLGSSCSSRCCCCTLPCVSRGLCARLLQVTCSDGKVPEQVESSSSLRGGPVLTDDEMEAKYRWVSEGCVLQGCGSSSSERRGCSCTRAWRDGLVAQQGTAGSRCIAMMCAACCPLSPAELLPLPACTGTSTRSTAAALSPPPPSTSPL